MKNIKTNPSRTVLTICIGLLVVYYFTDYKWLLYSSLIIGLVGVFSSYLSILIDRLWMKLAWVLSLVIPNILLGLVFYLVVFPIAVLSKIFRRTDFLTLRNPTSTLFTESNKQFGKTSFEKPW